MSWQRPLLATASGAAITLGSTAVSCGLALQVEKSANRALYWWSPELYAKVDQAYGITPEQLEHARRLAARQHAMVHTEQYIHNKDTWAYDVEDEEEDEEESSVPWQVPIPEITKQRLGLVHTAATTTRATILTTLRHHELIACSMTG